ncbi:MAG TPA: metalloregulator ArsR/SmtB family transcription factor [Candidatus Krumholzibacteria bacterium]|nr:metalloregulator ArsR/SmtB family transcription factor [Candidatus Krumholzibacteria bacterium]
MTGEATQELAARFKALGDATRLRILGLLARRARHGEELAAALEISPSTVSHHLKLLRQAGMVSITRENPYVLFRLRPETLRAVGSLLEDPYDLADTLDLPREESVDDDHVGPWLDERGRLRELPTHRLHRQTVLRWVLDQLDPARFYAEAELRLALDAIASEPDALRDLLVDAGFLRKSGSVYRVVETAGTE